MRYLIRSIKFLVALFVIYLAAVWIMIEAGASMLTMRETLQVLVHTTRGIVLIVAIVVWAAVYPRIGFVSRRVEGDMTEDRERIIAAISHSCHSAASFQPEILSWIFHRRE